MTQQQLTISNNAEDVINHLIQPLGRLFGKMPDAMTEALIEDCSRFTAGEMDKAVRVLRRRIKTKPSISHIVDACEEMEVSNKPSYIPGGENESQYPWEAKKKEAERICSEAIDTYKSSSTIWQEAVEQGWSGDLHEYLKAAAWPIAQHLAGKEQLSYSSAILFGWDKELTKARAEEYWAYAKKCIASRQIIITVPSWVVDQAKSSIRSK